MYQVLCVLPSTLLHYASVHLTGRIDGERQSDRPNDRPSDGSDFLFLNATE